MFIALYVHGVTDISRSVPLAISDQNTYHGAFTSIISDFANVASCYIDDLKSKLC